MTSAGRSGLADRTESYNSETGSFWNISDDEADSVNEEICPLGIPSRSLRRQNKLGRENIKVQSLEVRHIIGAKNDSRSSPLVFGPGGEVAYIAGSFVTIFDLRTNTQVQHLCLESRQRPFSCLAISEDGTLLAAGEEGQDASVVVWTLDTCPIRQPFELNAHRDTVTAMAFSPDGNFLATIGNVADSQLILWDCQSETVLCAQLINIQADLTSLSFSMDSKILYSSGKNQFSMWTLSQKSVKGGAGSSGISIASKSALPSSEKAEIVDVKAGYLGKSQVVFALGRSGLLYKLRMDKKGGLAIDKKVDLRVGRAFSLAVGPNKIAVSCSNGVVKIIRLKNLAVESSIPKPADSSRSSNVSSDALYCTFDHQSPLLAVAYSDNSVIFWNVEDSSEVQRVHTLHGHVGGITDIVSIPSSIEGQKSLDKNIVKAMRSPNIHSPQAVATEFATCSDKGVISRWNIKLYSQFPRQQAMISPVSASRHVHNPRVEIEMTSVSVNPPVGKPKPAVRRTKEVVRSVKSTKDSRKLASTAASSSQTTKTTTKKSVPKKAAAKKTTTTIKASAKGKRMVGTPGPMRLSTEITSSAVMRPPVVAVHKRGASKGNIALDGAPRQPVSDDTNLTVVRTSPDGMHLVAGDTKGVLRVYNLHSMKPLFKKELHSSPITTIEFSLVGEYGEILLATGAEDGSVSVMEVHNDFKVKLEKDDHEEPVTGISFSPDGKAVVSCGRDNYLYYESLSPAQWENEEDIELFLSRHFLMTSTFEAMHFNASRKTFMLACSDNFIRVFNLLGQFVHAIKIPGELGAPTKILEGPIPSMIITCHSNNTVGIFEYFTGKLIATGVCNSKLTGALLINGGRHLVTAGEDGLMVIWDLNEELCRRCIALPEKLGCAQTESGYANEFFFKIQREKERSSRIEGDYCYDEPRSNSPLMDRMSSFEQSLYSGASTPVYSRPQSRTSGVGLPPLSPMAQSSHPIMMPSNQGRTLPAWMRKADGMSDDGYFESFESASPSVYRPPKLNLDHISDTDDESMPLPIHQNRPQMFLDSTMVDLDSIPVDDFIGGFSRRGFSNELDRFNQPVDSMRWGRMSKNSYGSPTPYGASPQFGFQPSSSIAQYQYQYPEDIKRTPENSNRAFDRPTGPEPPSSVSCTSDSRGSTPFSAFPPNAFESEALLRNLRESADEQFVIDTTPNRSRLIGPHYPRIASRTPASMYSDDKTIYTRPNSEDHLNKMFAEMRPGSGESISPTYSPFFMDAPQSSMFDHGVGYEEPVDVAYLSDTDSEDMKFELPQASPDSKTGSAGRQMRKNPLFSSESDSVDIVRYPQRRMSTSMESSAVGGRSFEKEISFTEMADEEEEEDQVKADIQVRQSMDLIRKAVQSSINESLYKLKAAIGAHQSLSDCKLPTYRKQEYVDEAQKRLDAFLDSLQG